MTKYWINTISLSHVKRGEAGGFTQANHGKATGLKRLSKGDWLLFYSPKTDYPDGEPVQAFTALGQVTDDEPYEGVMTPEFHPWRRNLEFIPVQPVPIRPLIDGLSFIKVKERWGYAFRFGLFEIQEADFELIRSAMQTRVEGHTQ